MKQKEYEHCYKAKHQRTSTARMWLMMFKAWRYENQLKFGIIKHRHRRSIAQRKLHRLFPHLVVRMGYVWLKDDGIFPLDYLCPKRRRLWIGE